MRSLFLCGLLIVTGAVFAGCSSGGAPTAEDSAFQQQLADAAKNKAGGPKKKNTLLKPGDMKAGTSSAPASAPGSVPAAATN